MALTLQKAAQKMFLAAGATFDPAMAGPRAAALAYPSLFFSHDVCQDFTFLPNTTDDIAVVEDSTAGLTMDDAVGGVFSIATQPSTPLNNDEVYVSSLKEHYLFASGKPLYFEARVKLTEANVDDANIVIGLSDIVAADTLVDNGAGLVTSYDGALWFKVDGGTVWQFGVSNATTQTETTSAGAFTSGSHHVLAFFFDPGDGTTGVITPFFNGAVGTAHNILLSGLAEMHWLLGVKCGADTQVETIKADYVNVSGVR